MDLPREHQKQKLWKLCRTQRRESNANTRKKNHENMVNEVKHGQLT